MSVELKEIKESVVKLATDFQEEKSKLAEIGIKNNESLVKMQEDFATLSEKIQKAELKANEEKKSREQLELAIAQMGEKGADVLTGNSEYKLAFNSYAKYKSRIDENLVDAELKNIIKVQSGVDLSEKDFIHVKTMLVGSNPDGGYLAPVQLLSTISKRLFETSPMRSVANVITTANEAVEMVLKDGKFSSQHVSEMDDRNITDTSKLGIITIPTHEIYAMPAVTQKMLDDASINIESMIAEDIVEEFTLEENQRFFTGSGVKEAEGFLTLGDWTTLGTYERNKLETRETLTASTLAGDDLINLMTDLIEPYQANASWLMTRKTWAEIIKLKNAVTGDYLLNPAMLFQGTLGLQLLGKNVVICSDMESLADGNIPIAYGDFRKGYTVVDRMGMRVLRDPYTTKGIIKFYTTKRYGGKVTNYQAIKRLKIKSA